LSLDNTHLGEVVLARGDVAQVWVFALVGRGLRTHQTAVVKLAIGTHNSLGLTILEPVGPVKVTAKLT